MKNNLDLLRALRTKWNTSLYFTCIYDSRLFLEIIHIQVTLEKLFNEKETKNTQESQKLFQLLIYILINSIVNYGYKVQLFKLLGTNLITSNN